MNPEQREKAREGLSRWQELPPEQRERVKQQKDWYRNLPDDRKQELRESWQGTKQDGRKGEGGKGRR